MSASDVYRTLAAPADSLYKEKGSKFIGLAFPVGSEEEIKEILGQLRKKYFDARHHCYAYQLGTSGDLYRANDDGEPNHSAGDPILGQIRSANLTNVLVVVVRYFGGIKLGVGGLITAYRTTAAQALAAATVVERTETVILEILFDYEHLNNVMSLAKELKLEIQKQDFKIDCRLQVAVRKNLLGTVRERLANLARIKIIS
jgi:uncharacterized YigZ family protein